MPYRGINSILDGNGKVAELVISSRNGYFKVLQSNSRCGKIELQEKLILFNL